MLLSIVFVFFFFKQKTAYDMRISDWSSDVCSSDLIPEVSVDLRGGENRRAPYNVDVNPAGQTPALELDDGSILSEITAICEYLDEKYPEPTLIGSTPEERANTRMWTRRVDLKICEPLTNEIGRAHV